MLLTMKKTVHALLAGVVMLGAFVMPRPAASQVPLSYKDGDRIRSLVMDGGDYNSKFYRIPAIEVLPDGTLIAVADKRIETSADLPGKIDVVARRSTDGGKTWGPYITVAEHNEDGGYGDPAIIRDRRTGDLIVISTHGNGLWNKAPGRTSISSSRDGGLTWEKPVDVSDQIFTTAPNGKQPIKMTAGFASSGRALQLKNGRIMFVLVTRQEGVDPFPCYAIYSDNGGKTWKASKMPATLDGDESKVVELPNGDVLMSIRARFGKTRKFAISKDKGETWKELTDYNDLQDVRCNGDIIPVKYKGRDVLLQSLPAGPGRSNVTIYASYDGGKTWPRKCEVVRAPSAYSSMVLMPDGKTIAILTEEEAHNTDWKNYGYRIWFTSIPLSEILGE